MPSEPLPRIDLGLLSPVSVGHDALLSDEFVLTTMIRVECALVAAYVAVGAAPREARAEIDHTFGIDENTPRPCGLSTSTRSCATRSPGETP